MGTVTKRIQYLSLHAISNHELAQCHKHCVPLQQYLPLNNIGTDEQLL